MSTIFHDNLQRNLEKYYQYKGSSTRLFHRLRIDQLSRFHRKYKIKNFRILDVGCSAGGLSVPIASKNKEVVGIDLDVPALKKFRSWVKNSNIKNTKIDKGIAEKLSYSNNYFDLVVCSEVLEHVQNIEESVNEIYRVLKPKGLLFLSMPNKYGFPYVYLAISYFLKNKKRNPDPHTHFGPSRMKSLFPKFELLEEAGNGIIPLSLGVIKLITDNPTLSSAYYKSDKFLSKTPLNFFATNYFLVLQKSQKKSN